MATPPRIRLATIDDAPSIAAIHVAAHRFAYAGIAPDAYLDGLSAERRSDEWRVFLAAPPEALRLWLAERDGVAIGFCGTHGPEPDASAGLPPRTALLHWIHLDPEHVGTGSGRVLFAHAVDDLRAREYRHAVLWVLEGNTRARRFYQRAGWRPDGARAERFWEAGGTRWQAIEVRYACDLDAPKA